MSGRSFEDLDTLNWMSQLSAQQSFTLRFSLADQCALPRRSVPSPKRTSDPTVDCVAEYPREFDAISVCSDLEAPVPPDQIVEQF